MGEREVWNFLTATKKRVKYKISEKHYFSKSLPFLCFFVKNLRKFGGFCHYLMCNFYDAHFDSMDLFYSFFVQTKTSITLYYEGMEIFPGFGESKCDQTHFFDYSGKLKKN